MKRPHIIMVFLFAIIVVLALAQISVSNEISTTGAQLARLQDQVDNYKRENTMLSEQLLEASSFTNIEADAQKLGFVQAKSQITLNSSLPLALKQ